MRCVRGRILDYAVDLRGLADLWAACSGGAERGDGDQLYVPVGFGHAFVTLEPDVEVAYKVSDVYAPDCDGGVLWSDAAISIAWPLPPGEATRSAKDAQPADARPVRKPFDYDGASLEPLCEGPESFVPEAGGKAEWHRLPPADL